MCSTGELNVDGKTFTLPCAFVAPSPGPFVLTFDVGGSVFGISDPSGSTGYSKQYTHTIS
jgi:hypothetical protein